MNVFFLFQSRVQGDPFFFHEVIDAVSSKKYNLITSFQEEFQCFFFTREMNPFTLLNIMELEKLLNSDLVHGLAHVSRGMISIV